MALLPLCVFAESNAIGNVTVSVTDLRTERMISPMSIDTPTPRLGWRIVTNGDTPTTQLSLSNQEVPLRGDLGGSGTIMQTSYHIIVSSSFDKAQALEGDLWDVSADTDQSQWITYAGKELRSDTRCYWRVQVNTTQGLSEWSDIASWNVGLLTESDWKGQWIGLDYAMPWDSLTVHSRLSSRYLRTEFKVTKPIVRATLYISGLGMYEAFINGQRIGDQVLSPAPTDYRKTVLYNAFDVTSLLNADNNAIGVTLGNGRFFTMQQNKKLYKINNFGFPKLRLNLIIEYTDGSKYTVSSDNKWRLTADGPIRSSNEYDGEIYDARKELGDWTTVGYDDSAWLLAERAAIPQGTLRGAMSENMRVLKSLPPVSVQKRGDGFLVDMGQNMAGWLRLRISNATPGDTVFICFAETLDSIGNLYRDNLRTAIATDKYVPDGNENGRWFTPSFTYHGFRYALISGIPSITKDDVIGDVISDDMTFTGDFHCGDTILNKIFRNAQWGVLANYKGMPVDCPQRDERQPWLGDRARGCFGEAFLFDNDNLYAKWSRDIVEAQREDGCIPDVAPPFWNYYSDNVTWPSTLPFALEMLYNQYGDDAPLRKYYPAVKKWLAHLNYQYGKNGLMPRDKYGDWCVPPEDLSLIHSEDPARITDGTLIATAYYFRLCTLMQRFAKILGYEDDVKEYADLAQETKDAFNREFLNINKGSSVLPEENLLLYPDSTFYGNNTVTANLLPLSFGMIDDEYVRDEVQKNIIANIISKNNGFISCGIIGVQWLLHALTDMNRTDIAWLLATNKNYPSWGYMTEKGATTIWELWNGDTADPAMNSGNHVMLLGDLLSWLFEDVAGIRSDSILTGFKRIIMKPDFLCDELDDIDASYRSIYGDIISRWHKQNGILYWHVEIPANTTALLYLPDGSQRETGSGIYDITAPIPLPDNAIICDEFLYKQTSFPECHSATIAETTGGDLVATYFGGTKERNPDVCIWVSRKPKGSTEWTEPQLVADGIMSDTLRKACWNPVIYQNPNGELQIYFKIGESVSDWTGWIVRSNDNGITWSAREPLQENYLGPVKNKPVLSNGRLIAPTSVEKGGWRIYFEYSDDNGTTWKRTDFVETDSIKQVISPDTKEPPTTKDADNPELIDTELTDNQVNSETEKLEPAIKAIQPSIITLADGTLAALARTRSEHIGITYSHDNGITWSKLQLIDVPNNNSGLDAVTLRDGKHVMICNDKPIPHGIKNGKGVRTPLSLLISDDGINWEHWITLEDSPVSQYSYPSIIQTSDGHVHCIYTWRRQRIKHVELVPPAS
ncbi:MAG: family 78 glycoside hydrolase catalytic domain [Prevotella sp.]|nr:family 78 glycoside hydrolase catalytic domain [Prevotella sp.]